MDADGPAVVLNSFVSVPLEVANYSTSIEGTAVIGDEL